MRLPFVSRDRFEDTVTHYERRLIDLKAERRVEQQRFAVLFASYEKLRNTGHQPPPAPTPLTFADPAEEIVTKAEDEMRNSLVQQFISEGHSQTEAERAADELFAAWHGGAL